jgi:hypothetical protein
MLDATGFSPATFRRGIPLRRLGQQLNPFPLIQLPYHRLVNPWTLGAILHEVSHNLQNEIGLATTLPRAIARRLLQHGFPPSVAAIWTRWNRETFADLSGLLLGGPAVVASLIDVIGRSPATVTGYSPRGPHPVPYMRLFISTECLRRMGFLEEASNYERAWQRVYPNPRIGAIPPMALNSCRDAVKVVVDTICYQPYQELGDKRLSEVMRFGQKEQQMVEEAARRLAAPHVLQTQRAQFEALLLEIAEFAEEWLTSAQSLGLAGRTAGNRVLPWDRSAPQPTRVARAATNGHARAAARNGFRAA